MTTDAASARAGGHGHRGWINYLAVAREYRKRGFGRRLMDEAEALLRAIGCPKINLQIRSSNADVIAFYRSLGFSVDDSLSMASGWSRTEPTTSKRRVLANERTESQDPRQPVETPPQAIAANARCRR